jgi:hypothetical protein
MDRQTGVVTCAICGRTMDIAEENRNGGHYFRVAGWTKKRAQGGANAIKLAEYPQEFAHKMCVEYPPKLNREQQSLL